MKRIIGLLAFMGLLIALSGCATLTAATPDEEGEVKIVLTDYDFNPNTIRVKAGQKVTFVVSNQGDKMHEIMIGRDVNIEGNLTEGFHEDFFAGITPEIHGPGMVMGLEGGDMEHDMEGMAGDAMEHDMDAMAEDEEHDDGMEHNMDEMAEGEEHDDEMAGGEEHDDGMGHDDVMAEGEMEEMEQAEMDHDEEEMAGDAMAEMDHDEEMAEGEEHDDGMEHDDAMAEGEEHNDEMAAGDMEHDMEGMEHDMVETSFGALQRPLMDAHAGLMVMFDPTMIPANEVTTITFTVPEDKVGEWELGCFQEQGQHYDDGMRGTLIVEPSS